MNTSPAFQFYPDDFVGSGTVGTSTAEEVGIYALLMCLDWNDNGILFDSLRLARWCRTSEKKFLAAWEHIKHAFVEKDGRFFNHRLEREREKQATRREKLSENGKRGGRPKKAIGFEGESKSFSEENQNESLPSPSPSPSPKQTTLRASGDAPPYSAEFEMLWLAYPKRSGSANKQGAFRQFEARLAEGVTFEAMHDGVLRYAAWAHASGKVGTELVKMAATFLGRDKHFAESWDVPNTPQTNAVTGRRESSSQSRPLTADMIAW